MAQDLRLQLLSGHKGLYDESWAGPDPIRDDFSRLYLVNDGGGQVSVNDQLVVLRPSRVYLFPSGRWATYTCQKQMTLSWVHFRLEIPGGFDCLARFSPVTERAEQDGESETMNRLTRCLAEASPAACLKALACLSELLSGFLPPNWNELLPPREDLIRLEPVTAMMKSTLDRSLTLDELAERVHLHPTYLSNLFSRTYGIPPLKYHIQMRLSCAREALLATTLSIQAVALQLGYKDQFYFSRLFKRHIGISPTRFRQLGGTLNQTTRELKR